MSNVAGHLWGFEVLSEWAHLAQLKEVTIRLCHPFSSCTVSEKQQTIMRCKGAVESERRGEREVKFRLWSGDLET